MAVGRFWGKIQRLNPRSDACRIRLDIEEGNEKPPKQNEFQLETDHPAYMALFNLALAAAQNGWRINIRTTNAFEPKEERAPVEYMTVDW